MTPTELADELRAQAARADLREREHERTLLDLRVHQVELELQNGELREAQSRLEESRHRYQELYDFAPVAYYTLDGKGQILDVNLTGATMAGRERGELLGLPLAGVIELTEPPAFWRHLRRCATAGEPVVSELGLVVPGRGVRHVQAVSVPILDLAGRRVAYRTAFTDITERILAEAELARVGAREARRRRAFEGLDRMSRAVNEALSRPGTVSMTQILQTIADEAAALADAELVVLGLGGDGGRPLAPWVFAGRDRAHAAEVARRLRAIAMRTEAIRAGQSARIHAVDEHGASAGPAPVPGLTAFLGVPVGLGGRPCGQLYLANPHTAAEFTDDDEEVMELLAARAAKAIELAQLTEEVHEAVRARDTLLAIVSHDLRSPLSTVKLSVRRLAAEAHPDQVATLATIGSAVDRMDRLIEDLLQASTIEAGAFSVVAARTDTAALIAEAATAIRPLAAPRNIVVDADVELGVGALRGDRQRLLQVLGNLLGNAVKFVPDGGTIALRATAEGELLHLSVADNGPGIAPAQIPHLFDRYWKGGAGPRHGAGLGLYIARGIVQAHGGRLWVESLLGVGTTFHVTLPAWSERGHAVTAAAGSAPATATPSLLGRRVLVVDDDRDAAAALAALLDEEGMVVVEAHGGRQALALVEHEAPELAVIDLEMPDLDGATLLERLRAQFPGLPAVIASGHGPEHDRIQALLGRPRVIHVPKPLDLDRVLAALERLLPTG